MKKRYKFVLIPLGVLIMLLAAGLLFADWHGQRVLNREIDAVVAQGGYRDFSSFALPGLAEDDNAAPLWIESAVLGWGQSTADSRAYGPDETDDETLAALSDPAAADTEVLRRAIEARQPAIDMAWAAAERSAVRWPIDYDDPLSWLNEKYLGQTRQVGRLLAADARLALSDNDDERAEKSLLAILAVSDDVTVPPILISVLVSFSLDALAMDVIEDFDVHLAQRMPRLAAAFGDRDYLERIAQGTMGEIPYGLAYVQPGHPDTAHLSRWPMRLWVRYDIANYVRVMNQNGYFVGQPYFQIHSQLNASDQPTGFPYVLSGILLPAMNSTAKTASLIQTKRDLILVADNVLAVEPALRTDGWREGFALPIEPLTGQPVRMWLAEDGGFVLWSSAAEDPAMVSGRVEVVWRSGTDALPPELEPFVEDWAAE